jgi:hypothetical protein
VRLTGAHLRGDLSLQGITVKAPEHPAGAADAADITPQRQHAGGLPDGHDKTGYALIADGIKVDGTVALSDGFTAEGAVQLRSADISGSLICSGAHLDGRDENGYAGQSGCQAPISAGLLPAIALAWTDRTTKASPCSRAGSGPVPCTSTTGLPPPEP